MTYPIPFTKYHALGNDYLVVNDNCGVSLTELAKQICDRNRGIGADGILVERAAEGSAAFAVKIINPDGSEAEKSGNGLRIFCRWLWDNQRLTGFETSPRPVNYEFEIWTLGGIVKAKVPSEGSPISIEMGPVRVDGLPLVLAGGEVDLASRTAQVIFGGKTYRALMANIGNPHLVVDVRHVIESDWQTAGKSIALQYGERLEHDIRFSERTNVQFVCGAEEDQIQIVVWERGAGFTLASGSSACAAAAVANAWGICGKDIAVHMPGGILYVRLDSSMQATLTGPVTPVGEGRFWFEGER